MLQIWQLLCKIKKLANMLTEIILYDYYVRYIVIFLFEVDCTIIFSVNPNKIIGACYWPCCGQ